MKLPRLFCLSALSCLILAAGAHAADAPALVTKVAAEISAERIKADIEKLASFGTRHTASEARNPIKGIGAASNWLGQQLQSVNTLPGGGGPALGPKAAGMVKVFPEIWSEPAGELLPDETQLVNHVGFIRGKRPEAENFFYYVVAHYDSLAADPLDWAADAPGANDNASGVAALLEIARALADEPLDATVVFLLTSGGEQGSLGAKYHVENVLKLGYRVMGVINLDTIGGPLPTADGAASGGVRPARVIAPDARGMELARFVRAAAGGTRVSPQIELAAEGPGLAGDERLFSEQKFPAVMFTQAAGIPARHGAEDRAEAVDADYAADIARLAAGVIVHLANAPAPPGNVRFATSADGAAKIEWDKNTEGDVAGYEVVQRAKDSDEWTGARDVGVELSAPAPADDANLIFGVRAYDKSGYRSRVSVATPEPAKAH